MSQTLRFYSSLSRRQFVAMTGAGGSAIWQ